MFISLSEGLSHQVVVIFLSGRVFDLTDAHIREEGGGQRAHGVHSGDNEGVDDLGLPVASGFLANTALLQVDLQDGLAGGELQFVGLSDLLDVFVLLSEQVDDFLPGALRYHVVLLPAQLRSDRVY